MSQETKDAQREKERLSKNAKRQVESLVDGVYRRKNDCDRKKIQRQSETEEQGVHRRKINHIYIQRTRLIETIEESAKCKNTDCERKTKQ